MDIIGFTEILLPVAPVFQVYVLAPLALSITVLPAHTKFGPEMLTDKPEVTVTVTTAGVAAHPPEAVPVTV